MTRKQYFLSGLKDGMPICFGYFAVSFAFGIQAAGIGLSVFEASVLSALNVTSAGQFAALAIIASGASLIELAFTPWDRIVCTKDYSKQVEYSAENMEMALDALHKDPVFSAEHLKRLFG